MEIKPLLRWQPMFQYILFMHAVCIENMELYPPPCSDVPPLDLLERAVPNLHALPRGVNILYDHGSHVHAFKFSPISDNIYLQADSLFPNCQYFPYEFSLFITYKQNVPPKSEECIFSLFHKQTNKTILSVGFLKDRLVFRYKERRQSFQISPGYQDRQWHSLGVSVAAHSLLVSRDCRLHRHRQLHEPFPDLLPIGNTTFVVGKCGPRWSVFKGLIKSVVLIPGGDFTTRACVPKISIKKDLDNVIRTFPGYSTLTPFHSVAAVCRWNDVGNIAYDVHLGKLKVCTNGIWREVKLMPEENKLDYLVPHQVVTIGHGSYDVELFEVPGEGKFAAFAAGGQAGQWSAKSSIQQWKNGIFQHYQWLPTESAQSIEFFTIGSQSFLAVANYGKRQSLPCNSTIFKWNHVIKKFRRHQNILTYTARDVEAFQIEGDHYLVVANHARDNDNHVNSTVYKWAPTLGLFIEFQSLPTLGAFDWTHFTVDKYHFLVVANAFDNNSTWILSSVYIWHSGQWVLFQSIQTTGATDWEHFVIASEHYIVVANAYNYGNRNFLNLDNYRTNSTIYKLDRSLNRFVTYQQLSTDSAIDWEYLKIENEHYLFVSNSQSDGLKERQLSPVYRWQGLDKFVQVHSMYTPPNADVEVFKDKSNIFIIYACVNSSYSDIYKVKLT
ncbi:thrombospondin-type laminin G domain and EAR repeat-containing protein-like [Physella acuta]|uniref:thrombospondin-type laminin G domain and EAR repeat-containing protein-like n=1 Tax=Physella acuta TaxID=109671 RepID=UPI0027DB6618|nr:thrombospondin-type laminin G domain and EAR repeat-containing protein-like [Physella acuta]